MIVFLIESLIHAPTLFTFLSQLNQWIRKNIQEGIEIETRVDKRNWIASLSIMDTLLKVLK
jgi:hypothetical protein